MGKISDFKQVPIEKLRPYKNNAKMHSEEQVEAIAKSIEEFGFLSPCLIDEDYNIIAGHGRVMACKSLGITEVPCVFAEGLTDAQRRAYILADNRLTEMGDWDQEKLSQELNDLFSEGFKIELTGFSFDDINDDDLMFTEDMINETDETEEIEPRVKRGQIWKLGEHRLMCGDATSNEDFSKLMEQDNETLIDLLLTDPPYNVAYEGKTEEKLTIANDNMNSEVYQDFLFSAFNNANTYMKRGASFYIWYASRETINVMIACERAELDVKQQLIWNKNSMTLGRQDYQWKHEPCLYGWKAGASHYFTDDRTQTTVMDFNKPSANIEHPTMKPTNLIAHLIANSTKLEEKVLDMFGGSGTTLIACEQLGRKCYMMEYEPHYCDVIIDRWERFTGEKAEIIKE